jgi:hypothetical protein
LIPSGAETVAEPQARNPEAVRGRLTEYQRGLRQGRYAQTEPAEAIERNGDPANRGQE